MREKEWKPFRSPPLHINYFDDVRPLKGGWGCESEENAFAFPGKIVYDLLLGIYTRTDHRSFLSGLKDKKNKQTGIFWEGKGILEKSWSEIKVKHLFHLIAERFCAEDWRNRSSKPPLGTCPETALRISKKALETSGGRKKKLDPESKHV